MKKSVTSIEAHQISIDSKNSAEAFATLLQAKSVSVESLMVLGKIGGEGWQVLVRALREKHNGVQVEWVQASKEGWTEVRKEDIKAIWDVTNWNGGLGVISESMWANKDELDEFVAEIAEQGEEEKGEPGGGEDGDTEDDVGEGNGMDD